MDPGTFSDLFVFVFGVSMGILVPPIWGHFKRGSKHVPLTGRNRGCSKTIQHICQCVKPHGHESADENAYAADNEIRWHVCEHGALYATTQKGEPIAPDARSED